MKVYVIVPINYEYDDCYYNEQGLEGPVSAFRSRRNAERRLGEMTQERRSEIGSEFRLYRDEDGERAQDLYKIVELDVPDSDVEAA